MRCEVIKARDGLELPAYLSLPLGAEPKQLPMILNVHGGPWARDAWGYRPDTQWFTNRGYAVLQVRQCRKRSAVLCCMYPYCSEHCICVTESVQFLAERQWLAKSVSFWIQHVLGAYQMICLLLRGAWAAAGMLGALF